jgi:hypothetical protein
MMKMKSRKLPPKAMASALRSPALRMFRRIMNSASSGIPVLDRVKDALVLGECPAPESNAVAAAAIKPQQRVELIAQILNQKRVSTRPRDPKVEILISGTQRTDSKSKKRDACATGAEQSLSSNLIRN